MEKNEPIILLISPHSEVKLIDTPRYGFERRVSFIGRAICEKFKTVIIEPDDVKNNKYKEKTWFDARTDG